MTIRTYYYTHSQDWSNIYKIPVTIVDKRIMPNRPTSYEHVHDWFVVDSKTDYDIQWLYPTDPDYHAEHDIKITFCYQGSDKPSDFYIHLDWLDRQKMKIIWGEYFLFRGDNFDRFIFKPLLAIASGLVGYLIKTYTG